MFHPGERGTPISSSPFAANLMNFDVGKSKIHIYDFPLIYILKYTQINISKVYRHQICTVSLVRTIYFDIKRNGHIKKETKIIVIFLDHKILYLRVIEIMFFRRQKCGMENSTWKTANFKCKNSVTRISLILNYLFIFYEMET